MGFAVGGGATSFGYTEDLAALPPPLFKSYFLSEIESAETCLASGLLGSTIIFEELNIF
jgi:hypothetical protein